MDTPCFIKVASIYSRGLQIPYVLSKYVDGVAQTFHQVTIPPYLHTFCTKSYATENSITDTNCRQVGRRSQNSLRNVLVSVGTRPFTVFVAPEWEE